MLGYYLFYLHVLNLIFLLGSGCGKVGRVVASKNRGQRFIYNHLKFLNRTTQTGKCCELKKRAKFCRFKIFIFVFKKQLKENAVLKVSKIKTIIGAGKSQWICLLLPSCSPGFQFQAHHPSFYMVKFYTTWILPLYWKRTEINKKAVGFDHILGLCCRIQSSLSQNLSLINCHIWLPLASSNFSFSLSRHLIHFLNYTFSCPLTSL